MIYKDFHDGRFYNADCFDVFPEIPDGVVDMVLADLPYGTTDCKWDSVIDLTRMWETFARVLKPTGAVVLTATQPFASRLILSNLDAFRYDWVWDKVNRNTGYGNAKKMPLRRHEHVLLFAYRTPVTYNPQMTEGKPYVAKRSGNKPGVYANGGLKPQDGVNDGTRYPVSVLQIKGDVKTEMGLHPTQKPVALFEYLIRTYTQPGELVLDNTAGSGTTAVAARACERRWVCIEKDPEYYAKALGRLE